MAHWAGNRNIPDAHYPTNAKWPEPWQPWKRHALKQRKNGFPSRLALESELSEIEHEKKLIEHGNDSNKLLFEAILQVKHYSSFHNAHCDSSTFCKGGEGVATDVFRVQHSTGLSPDTRSTGKEEGRRLCFSRKKYLTVASFFRIAPSLLVKILRENREKIVRDVSRNSSFGNLGLVAVDKEQ